MTPRPDILMLAGSYTTPEMAELSLLYARGCERALTPHFAFTTLYRAPDGGWRVVDRIDRIERATPLSEDDALARLAGRRFSAGLPQMFCAPGMTRGRALFDRLGIPMVGNPPPVMGVATDKARTRDVVAAAGVAVPAGVVVAPGEALPELPPLPLIVKPATADNSDGLTLVTDWNVLPSAIARAHLHGDALIEAFIPAGREMRCGVIERDGELHVLPPEEYPVNAHDHPIRTRDDKLGRPDGEALALMAKTAQAAWIVEREDPDIPALSDAALSAYRALDCRHYGLFDFRIDAQGRPWFLEAGLYCSFSPDSVIAAMALADGIALDALLRSFIPASPAAIDANTHPRDTANVQSEATTEAVPMPA